MDNQIAIKRNMLERLGFFFACIFVCLFVCFFFYFLFFFFFFAFRGCVLLVFFLVLFGGFFVFWVCFFFVFFQFYFLVSSLFERNSFLTFFISQDEAQTQIQYKCIFPAVSIHEYRRWELWDKDSPRSRWESIDKDSTHEIRNSKKYLNIWLNK